MKLFDTDEDEKITREEFTALLYSALGVSDLNMAKLFKEIDADGSGYITFSELTLTSDTASRAVCVFLPYFTSYFGFSTLGCSPTAFPFVCNSTGEFQAFALNHPVYAKLFTTYLELQRYHAIQEALPGDLELTGQLDSKGTEEESTSDKKDDWTTDKCLD